MPREDAFLFDVGISAKYINALQGQLAESVRLNINSTGNANQWNLLCPGVEGVGV